MQQQHLSLSTALVLCLLEFITSIGLQSTQRLETEPLGVPAPVTTVERLVEAAT